jgi:hypothetical protein
LNNNATKMNHDVQNATKTLTGLKAPIIESLVRRAGKRAESDASPERSSKPKGSYSDPTLSSVVRKMSGRKINDPVFDAVKELAQTLNDISSLSDRVDRLVRFVTEDAERAKVALIHYCGACEREVTGTKSDRIKSGYCEACYRQWLREGKPYRNSFELSRKLSEETPKTQ